MSAKDGVTLLSLVDGLKTESSQACEAEDICSRVATHEDKAILKEWSYMTLFLLMCLVSIVVKMLIERRSFLRALKEVPYPLAVPFIGNAYQLNCSATGKSLHWSFIVWRRTSRNSADLRDNRDCFDGSFLYFVYCNLAVGCWLIYDCRHWKERSRLAKKKYVRYKDIICNTLWQNSCESETIL